MKACEMESIKKRFMCSGCGHSLEVVNAENDHVSVEALAITMPDQTVSLVCQKCIQRAQDLPAPAKFWLFADAQEVGSPQAYMMNRYLLAEAWLEGAWRHTLPRPPGQGKPENG